MLIGVISEGPTDRLMVEAVIRHLFPGDHQYRLLQPQDGGGPYGNGWKGVRRWCSETHQGDLPRLADYFSGAVGVVYDLLVIHLDADIRDETDLCEGLPTPPDRGDLTCPPITAAGEYVRRVALAWLGSPESLPPQVVWMLPAQDTETWTFTALHPNDARCGEPGLECTHSGNRHPAHLLTLAQYGKHLSRKDGTVKKSQSAYRALVPSISAAWLNVKARCEQARAFEAELRAAISPPTPPSGSASP
jgi:hypothetical protein